MACLIIFFVKCSFPVCYFFYFTNTALCGNKQSFRKLIHFGMIEGLLRRVQRYPVHPNPDLPTPFAITRAEQQRVYKYMDGLHSFDEICCLCGMLINVPLFLWFMMCCLLMSYRFIGSCYSIIPLVHDVSSFLGYFC